MATKQEKNPKPDLAMLMDWRSVASAQARKKHWEWFVIDQFIRGNHNVRGNPSDNTIEISRGAQSINYPINKMYVNFRAVRAFVTRHRPFVEIDVDDSKDPKVLDYARRANSLIKRDNKLNNFHKINKDWVFYGVKYGAGYRQIGYDTQKKCCIRWTIDPFDLLIGSATGNFKDAPYLIKDVVRTIAYLKNKYPKYGGVFAPDNELAADEYKRLGLQIQNQDAYGITTSSIGEQTKIVHECWYRLFEKNSKGGIINKVTFVDTGIVDEEETPYDEYPFIAYYASEEPNEIHPDGHMKQTVAPQRMFNLLNTQKLEYNHIVNRGRFVTDKDSGFQVINTKDGQIIRVNKGKRLLVVNPPSINPLLDSHSKDAERYIEDIGGQHDASLGATPPRLASGIAIDQIQQGDSNNISDLRDNFEDSLAQEAAMILKMYSLFESEGVVINDVVNEADVKPVAMIGQKALETLGKKVPDKYFLEGEGDYCEVCTVLTENKVTASVQSEFGETKEAKFNMLLKLRDAGLPLTTILKLIEFPNAADVTERIANEAVADMAMEAMKAKMQAQTDSQAAAQAQEPSRLPPDINALNNQAGGMLSG